MARLSYAAPGVYVEEVDTGTRPIEAVGTSVAAFVGKAPIANARLHEAFACNNWEQFYSNYCDPEKLDKKQTTDLAQAVQSFFLNGGSRCYIVNTGDDGISGGGGKPRGVDVLKAIDEVAIVAAPGATDVGSQQALIDHCELLKDRVCILDVPSDVADLNALTRVGGAPPPVGASGADKPGGVDKPGGADKPKTLAPSKNDLGPPRSSYAAAYFPSLLTPNIFDSKTVEDTPPSGAMAGIYARTDTNRGVHKAPANEAIKGARGLSRAVTQQDQELLNPSGINCLRYSPRAGTLVWGARTCSSDPQWRYINVRRVFCMVEESITIGTQWVVFEPNDRMLWGAVKRDAVAFLTSLWRDGALMGATPEQAFFVRCDEGLNPPEVRDQGRLIIEIGLAVVKPAEFVIFRIGQSAGNTGGAS